MNGDIKSCKSSSSVLCCQYMSRGMWTGHHLFTLPCVNCWIMASMLDTKLISVTYYVLNLTQVYVDNTSGHQSSCMYIYIYRNSTPSRHLRPTSLISKYFSDLCYYLTICLKLHFKCPPMSARSPYVMSRVRLS